MTYANHLGPAERHFMRYRHAFLITDASMLLYWVVTAAAALGVLDLAPEYLYSDYDNPVVVAWNWSFLALDLVFCVAGLCAFLLLRQGNPAWREVAIIAAVTTSISGLMAISYWTIRLEFDPGWWLPNLALLLWPIRFLVGLFQLPPMESAKATP